MILPSHFAIDKILVPLAQTQTPNYLVSVTAQVQQPWEKQDEIGYVYSAFGC